MRTALAAAATVDTEVYVTPATLCRRTMSNGHHSWALRPVPPPSSAPQPLCETRRHTHRLSQPLLAQLHAGAGVSRRPWFPPPNPTEAAPLHTSPLPGRSALHGQNLTARQCHCQSPVHTTEASQAFCPAVRHSWTGNLF